MVRGEPAGGVDISEETVSRGIMSIKMECGGSGEWRDSQWKTEKSV